MILHHAEVLWKIFKDGTLMGPTLPHVDQVLPVLGVRDLAEITKLDREPWDMEIEYIAWGYFILSCVIEIHEISEKKLKM